MKEQVLVSQTFAGMSIKLEFVKQYFVLIAILLYLSSIYDE